MYDEFPKKSTSGTSANGGPVWKRRLLYKLSIFWGSILVLGSVVAGFLPPNFSQKKIYCAAVKVDRLPRHHHVLLFFQSPPPPCLLFFQSPPPLSFGVQFFQSPPPCLLFIFIPLFYLSFSDRFVDPSMALIRAEGKKNNPHKSQQLETTYWKNPGLKNMRPSKWIIFAGIGVKVKNVSNHHLETGVIILPTQTRHNYKGNRSKLPYICIVWSPQSRWFTDPLPTKQNPQPETKTPCLSSPGCWNSVLIAMYCSETAVANDNGILCQYAFRNETETGAPRKKIL